MHISVLEWVIILLTLAMEGLLHLGRIHSSHNVPVID